MDRDDWGVKRVCLTCGARFYDFDKSPIVCPLCSTVFDPDYLSKRKTKNFQDKVESVVVDDVDTVADDDDVIDGAGDDLDETDADIPLDDEKN
jgi:uncharacterized protein (TIGR02300 family)